MSRKSFTPSPDVREISRFSALFGDSPKILALLLMGFFLGYSLLGILLKPLFLKAFPEGESGPVHSHAAIGRGQTQLLTDLLHGLFLEDLQKKDTGKARGKPFHTLPKDFPELPVFKG